MSDKKFKNGLYKNNEVPLKKEGLVHMRNQRSILNKKGYACLSADRVNG